jgi:hypothetical protein
MKSFKDILQKSADLNEGHDEYVADDMTIKELKIAINSAKNILDMIEDGAMIQRWQISAIVKASEELSSVCTSMRADEEEEEDHDWGAEINYNYYPSMYGESADTHKTKDGRTAKKGLWYNIHQRKKKGLLPKKPGEEGYPKTLNIDEEIELDEASTKVEIPKSRYLTIAKMHDASGPTHGIVTRSPKGTMQYKGARHLEHDKKTDTHIVKTYSHGDHGLATIEKHTHGPSGQVKYFIHKKSTNEEMELDESIEGNDYSSKRTNEKKSTHAHPNGKHIHHILHKGEVVGTIEPYSASKEKRKPGSRIVQSRTPITQYQIHFEAGKGPTKSADIPLYHKLYHGNVESALRSAASVHSSWMKKNEEVELDEAFKIGDKVTYQKSKRERGNAIISGVSAAKKNHFYIKTEKEGTIMVPAGELELNESAARNADMVDIVRGKLSIKDALNKYTKDEIRKGIKQINRFDSKLQDPLLKEELDFKVKVDGLPDLYVNGDSPSQVKMNLRKIVKKPDMIQSVDRITQATLKKILRDKVAGKEEMEESSFVAKAAHAKIAGDETFKLKGSDDAHPVTIKHHHARKIKKAVSEEAELEEGYNDPVHRKSISDVVHEYVSKDDPKHNKIVDHLHKATNYGNKTMDSLESESGISTGSARRITKAVADHMKANFGSPSKTQTQSQRVGAYLKQKWVK